MEYVAKLLPCCKTLFLFTNRSVAVNVLFVMMFFTLLAEVTVLLKTGSVSTPVSLIPVGNQLNELEAPEGSPLAYFLNGKVKYTI